VSSGTLNLSKSINQPVSVFYNYSQTSVNSSINPLTPTAAIWVQPWSILCQTTLSSHL